MISKGKKVSENGSFTRYSGVGICKVLAVNPNKAESEKLYGRELENEPVYLTERELENGKKVPSVRITFVCETTSILLQDPVLLPVTFFVSNTYRYNSDRTKVQIIDAYGRTAWATKDEVKSKAIPDYRNGKARISEGYRVALEGEAELTQFLQALINIPSVDKYNAKDKTWSMVQHPEDSESRLDCIKDYFRGDFSELRDIITYQPENQVRVLFGVRTDKEGRLQQDVYTRKFLRLYQKNYELFKTEIEDAKRQGYMKDRDFTFTALKEYSVEPTDLTNSKEVSASVDDDLPEDTMPSPQSEPQPVPQSSDDDSDDLPFEL